jgi:DNA-binding NarL/FixJ family response regulator
MAELRVVVVDDQQLVRMGLAALVNSEPDLTLAGEASDGAEAVRVVKRLKPDVVLMDIRMPGTDGLTALGMISADPDLADVHVVMLTTFEIDDYVFAALEAGAAGFLIKDAEPDEITRAIRVAAAGDGLLSPTVTRRVIAEVARGRASRPEHVPEVDQLTDREREVLALVAEGLNNEEIAGRLVISPATARTHVSRILMKTHARDRAQLVVLAYRSGLVQ